MDASIDVNVTSRTDEVKEELEAAIGRALDRIGLRGERHAKEYCPVDTGRLRSSISHAVREEAHEAIIGTNVEYAPYVELGTSRQKAQPYLKPAAEKHGTEYKQILESELKGTI